MAIEEGLCLEAERIRQFVRDCETTKAEMDQIEAYRKDQTIESRYTTMMNAEASGWFHEKVYLPKRQRTVRLVMASVDALCR